MVESHLTSHKGFGRPVRLSLRCREVVHVAKLIILVYTASRIIEGMRRRSPQRSARVACCVCALLRRCSACQALAACVQRRPESVTNRCSDAQRWHEARMPRRPHTPAQPPAATGSGARCWRHALSWAPACLQTAWTSAAARRLTAASAAGAAQRTPAQMTPPRPPAAAAARRPERWRSRTPASQQPRTQRAPAAAAQASPCRPAVAAPRRRTPPPALPQTPRRGARPLGTRPSRTLGTASVARSCR